MPDLQSIPWEGNRQCTAKIPIIHRQPLWVTGWSRCLRFDLFMGLLIMDIPIPVFQGPAWPSLSRGPLGFRNGPHPFVQPRRRSYPLPIQASARKPFQSFLSAPSLGTGVKDPLLVQASRTRMTGKPVTLYRVLQLSLFRGCLIMLNCKASGCEKSLP